MAENPVSIVVVGSVNLDLAASVSRLPIAGETVTGATLQRFPGGKGANQALAAKRLGAEVSMVACVGTDAAADEALELLREGGVDLSAVGTHPAEATGVALIAVAPDGENQIVVAPGANRKLKPGMFDLPEADALICQLEVPVETLVRAGELFEGFFCINLAPAMDVPSEIFRRADLLVMNETEAAFYGQSAIELDALVAVTFGAAGAELRRGSKSIAQSKPPAVDVVDTVGAGDTFTAALTVALIEGKAPQDALVFACAAAALSTTKEGAQPSLPDREEVDALLR